MPDLRLQDTKNRQNSIDGVSAEQKAFLQGRIHQYFIEGMDLYNELLREGIAKECARFVLPLAAPTRIFMTGSVRSWVHYIDLRSGHGTQKEHMDIANLVRSTSSVSFLPLLRHWSGSVSQMIVDVTRNAMINPLSS